MARFLFFIEKIISFSYKMDCYIQEEKRKKEKKMDRS